MIRALYSSASGLQAQQNNLDVIANNLANVNTTGFKKSKIEFQDLLYQAKRMAGSEQGSGNQLPAGIEIGHGDGGAAARKRGGERGAESAGAAGDEDGFASPVCAHDVFRE